MHPTLRAAAIVLLCAVCGVWALSTDKFKEIVEPAVKECKQETPDATDADVENIMHREELTTRSGKCLQYCVYEKLGGMRDGHVVSKEEALKVLHRVYDGDFEKLQNASAKIDHCGAEVMQSKETDRCEIANQVQQCFRRLH